MARVWAEALDRVAGLTDRFPDAHSGVERLPRVPDGSAIAVVDAAVSKLRQEVCHQALAG